VRKKGKRQTKETRQEKVEQSVSIYYTYITGIWYLSDIFVLLFLFYYTVCCMFLYKIIKKGHGGDWMGKEMKGKERKGKKRMGWDGK
jgi:hypothetical protein